MDIRTLTARVSVGPQIAPGDMAEIAIRGFRAVICNHPDGKGADQPTFAEIAQAAAKHGLEARHLPIVSGKVRDADAEGFGTALTELPGRVLAYCRTEMRSTALWALSRADWPELKVILRIAKSAGYDMGGVVRRIVSGGRSPASEADASFEVVIVGGGAAGIAVAASLHRRQPRAAIAIIDPADVHYYQPGWTMVGGGIFEAAQTVRTMGSLIPEAVRWIKAGVAAFDPGTDSVILEGSRIIRYERLIVCPGLKLDWDAVEGLPQTLGRNGVTSNYRYDLVAVDGTRQAATFDVRRPDAPAETVEMEFDMLHVCPPQTAPDFISVSPLASADGWVDVDRSTLRHKAFDNIRSLGDVTNVPNAKTAAAARAQAPVVAENIAADMDGQAPTAQYDGDGSCPLTVERCKVVLAEFGYGGTLLPTFPKALIDGTRPSRAAWLLKEKILPTVYWQGMLKGHEWLVRPETIPVE